MTRRCFIIGHPVAHSRSPLIHGHWLAEHGLAGSYERVDVPPAEVPAFIARLRFGEFVGGNVTVPNKEIVLPLLDHVSETARAMGAANTLWMEGDRLHGDNTDAYGFLAHLDALAPDWLARCETALVVGAGGAARAVIHGLAGRGVRRILLVNRSSERAHELAAAFPKVVETRRWEDTSGLVGESDLIVNTTSLGMRGQPPLEIDVSGLRPGTIVDDIVYVPLETPLLAEARRRGGIPVDGLGMLLHQAVPGFERWFGVRPQVTAELRAKLEADIPAA
ncbi:MULTISPECIES: shikimate dehydrogenase [unclassified Bosea (in: a-proteobacteria)]|uniref:shikimate dehydrogenase n=1 Tax=unclassified Bosea (in: a-proteobacteria) TaxID=2653178 RepID=UPI000F752170|nr:MULTISPECIES: shikimate dehydrogenase [unclassified Bosea (in: a-proteobacteria)]AZO79856.1 shikimate dehydrogenase [Bosea sp. Tri-49]RXT15882.1 shikimate dehydrogenase [Bosea sp. Tri-39]RXT39574.1 shikimate dehydrogenase [Bosea sp. Tri-54]